MVGRITTALVVLGVLGAGAVIVLIALPAWNALAGASDSDRIVGRAAIAQAASAAFVLFLTVVLALLAFGALNAARRQAEAAMIAAGHAAQANLELRVERELSVLPVLSAIRQPPTPHADGKLGLQIRAQNWTSHPAVRVTMTLYGGPWRGTPPEEMPSGEIIEESPHVYEVVPQERTDGKAFGWILKAGYPADIVVLLEYASPLGATVWQTYEFRAHEPWDFRLRERHIRTSVPDAEPIVTRYLVGWDGTTG